MDLDIKLVNPAVLHLQVDKFEAEEHIEWQVGIAPENEQAEEEDPFPVRVVFGTLHTHDNTGGGTITVSALLKQISQEIPDLESVKDSDELETLYDFARIMLSSALGLISATPPLPTKAPEPEMAFLVKVDPKEHG